MPLFILSSVYLSRNESTSSVQYGMQSHFRNFINTTNSDKIFIVIISLKKKKKKQVTCLKRSSKRENTMGFKISMQISQQILELILCLKVCIFIYFISVVLYNKIIPHLFLYFLFFVLVEGGGSSKVRLCAENMYQTC